MVKFNIFIGRVNDMKYILTELLDYDREVLDGLTEIEDIFRRSFNGKKLRFIRFDCQIIIDELLILHSKTDDMIRDYEHKLEVHSNDPEMQFLIYLDIEYLARKTNRFSEMIRVNIDKYLED